MRTSVINLVSLGRLPNERSAAVLQLQAFEAALRAIERPVTDEEAMSLLQVLPSTEDSCFGLAWSVLHLIETAPVWPLKEAKLQHSNPWVASMLERVS
jgi:hypothetical protein